MRPPKLLGPGVVIWPRSAITARKDRRGEGRKANRGARRTLGLFGALAPFALIDGETAAPSAFFVTGGVTLPRRCDGIALLSPSPWPSKGRPEYFLFHPAFINANHL